MTKTLPETFRIQDDFPPVDYDQWRSVVDQALGGAPFERKLVSRTYDGVDIQPIYCSRGEGQLDDPLGVPGFTPFIRGSHLLGQTQCGWDLRQEFRHPDPAATNRSILSDLKGGVTSLRLRFDAAARSGLDPSSDAGAALAGSDGIMIYCVDDLDEVLADVQLGSLQVTIDAGAAFLPASAMLVGLWQRRGISPGDARGAFNADPLAALAREGGLPTSAGDALDLLADLATWTSQRFPRVTAVEVDTTPYHDAGATATQDIALGAATALEYLRAMTAAGLDVDAAARQILFRIGLGTHHFQAIAKLRAARQVWSRVVEASGGSRQAQQMRIQTRTADRVLTRHDPYVNLLRNSVAVFAAGVGGADAITSVPFNARIGLPDEFSRRVARNTVLVLQEESHLHRVVDPAGGSWYLDQITEDLAAKAWEIFQETERQGGMLSALSKGWVSEQIDGAFQPRAADIARRKNGITGVSEFPDIAQERVTATPPDLDALRSAASNRIAKKPTFAADAFASTTDKTSAAVTAASDGATINQIADGLGFQVGSGAAVNALTLRSFAEPFEQLRDACDAWEAKHGSRPRVFLANFGPVAHYTARATWSKNFFEAGGFEVIGSGGFEGADAAANAFRGSGAAIAVICSSDKLYPDVVPQAATALKESGATSVVLAGNPGDNEQPWREAGVDRFIFVKCNVLETLRELLHECGVIESGVSEVGVPQ
jgi:methylmalonyl-CoA mutase